MAEVVEVEERHEMAQGDIGHLKQRLAAGLLPSMQDIHTSFAEEFAQEEQAELYCKVELEEAD